MVVDPPVSVNDVFFNTSKLNSRSMYGLDGRIDVLGIPQNLGVLLHLPQKVVLKSTLPLGLLDVDHGIVDVVVNVEGVVARLPTSGTGSATTGRRIGRSRISARIRFVNATAGAAALHLSRLVLVREHQGDKVLLLGVVEGRQLGHVDACVELHVTPQLPEGELDVHLGRELPHLSAVGILPGGDVVSLGGGGTIGVEDAVVVGDVCRDELGTGKDEELLVPLLAGLDLGQLGGMALPNDAGDGVLHASVLDAGTDMAEDGQEG
mmetsp:Transcript_1481/g.4277  ORF Transcript_1481/g.4277 Transcript_1481/m.4277 type:complete len:264 (+) Transcript_1481:59-850(+)